MRASMIDCKSNIKVPGRLSLLPPWDRKVSTSQRAVKLCGWEGNRRPGGE